MKHSLPTNGSPDRSPDPDELPNELINTARQYFSTDFPNPQRNGCPAAGDIQTLVGARRAPNEELRAHLFGCSECFNEYRAAVQQRHQFAATKTGTSRLAEWIALWQRRTPLLAVSAALLMAAFGLFIWRSRQSAPSQISQVRPQPVSQAPANGETARPEPSGTIPPNSNHVERPRSMAEQLLAFKVDLNEHRSLGAYSRAATGSQAATPIFLPRARFRLTLQLRDNSAAGNYRVSVLDSSEHRRSTALASTHDTQMLQVTLDLRSFPESNATLRLERSDQSNVAPEDYLAEIGRL